MSIKMTSGRSFLASATAGVTILELSRHDEGLESLFFDLVHHEEAAA
jgi:hypothetical protein